eukprot:3260271-Rhodomonas_salina.2
MMGCGDAGLGASMALASGGGGLSLARTQDDLVSCPSHPSQHDRVYGHADGRRRRHDHWHREQGSSSSTQRGSCSLRCSIIQTGKYCIQVDVNRTRKSCSEENPRKRHHDDSATTIIKTDHPRFRFRPLYTVLHHHNHDDDAWY